MFKDSEEEISELDLESRTWNKLQKNIASIGFREGAAKGKELSLQEGFNLGYLEGFKLGEYIGNIKGILSAESKQKLTFNENVTFNEESFCSLSSETCVLCSKENILRTSSKEEISFEKLEDLISMQHGHSKEMMKTIKKKLDLHDLKSYLDKE